MFWAMISIKEGNAPRAAYLEYPLQAYVLHMETQYLLYRTDNRFAFLLLLVSCTWV
jgi:hypothetical protein